MAKDTNDLQKSEEARLPVGEEQNRFNAKEFEKWLEWLEAVMGCFVEQDQAIEGNCDRDVVYEGNPNVPIVQFQNSLLAEAVIVEHQL